MRDTITIRGTQICLHGIDAPEKDQACRAAGVIWKCGYEAAGTRGCQNPVILLFNDADEDEPLIR
ncbi:MAG TPA: hypothetical protein DG761_01915 [Gammaproteobacteria bacterium]|nr:hypothetical protein [Acidiferrobacteraceae bacterium]HCX86762.1 hypothetical protein [Gammaproteobacteria bacterium]